MPFIYFSEQDSDGQRKYYILQKQFPHFVGVICEAPKSGTWQSPVAGYNLWVVFQGTLNGRLIPSYKNISDEMQAVFDSMAQWFAFNIVAPNPTKYKKFKINV